jgi:cysteine-rich repeat protein
MTTFLRPLSFATLPLVLLACLPGCTDVPGDATGGSGGGSGGGGGMLPDPDTCGDGVVDLGEHCDDGDFDDTDACATDCTLTDPPDGEPIEAEEDVWTYVPIEGSICRDGSPTGIMVNPSSTSDDVVVYLEGGGACFNFASCIAGNPDSFDPTDFAREDGLFDRDAADNPLRDFNFVYVPYCTGDVHVGDNAMKVSGMAGVQEFRGYPNVSRALERVVPTFPNAAQVLLTGVSGGGFGAAGNYEQVQRAFHGVPVILLDDSGPPMGTEQIPTCLQDEWRETWGFDATLLAECGESCPNPDDYVLDLTAHMLSRYPDAVGALISYTTDSVIRTFYGFGRSDCSAIIGSVPEESYTNGLMDLRDFVDARSATFGSFYIEGSSHTCLGGDCFYETTIEGVPLTQFVSDLLDGNTSHVGPEL